MTVPLARRPMAQGTTSVAGPDADTNKPSSANDAEIVARDLDHCAAAILALLIERAGTCVGKDELLEAGWPGRIVHENSLAKAIGRIRQSLNAHDLFTLEAVYGRGYILEKMAPAQGESGLQASPPAALRHDPPWWRRSLFLPGALASVVALAAVSTFLLIPQEPAARGESEEAAALMAFLSEDLILPTDPYASVPANPVLRDVVERTAETMDERFAGQPAALTALNILVAKAFSGWGEYDRAVNHLTSARSQALASGSSEEGARLVEIDALTCQQMRLAGQTRRAEQVCAGAARQGEMLESTHRFMALVNLGKLQFEIGKYADAAANLDRILDGETDVTPEIQADALWFRALALRKLARFDEAERDFVAHIEQRQALHGSDHPMTAWAHSDYGDYLGNIGEYDRARAELAKAQVIFDRRLGADHVESQSPAYSIALIHLNMGEADEAAAILAPMLASYSAKLGRDHFWTAYVMTELALARAMQGEADDARELLREVRANAANELYGRPAKAAWFHLRWARAMAEIGDEATARDELRRARSGISKGFAGDHPWLARADCIAVRIERIAGNASAEKSALANCAKRLENDKIPSTYPLRADLRQLAMV